MSNMSDLDVVLSEYKLSDAQKNAVIEVIGGEITNAKINTLKSLEKKGLIEERLDGWSLSDSLADEIRPILERNKAVFEQFNDVPSPSWLAEWQGAPSVADTVQAVQEVMFLGGESGDGVEDPSKIKLGLTSAAPMADWELQLMDVTRDQAERFDYSLGREINSLLGFGELYEWKNPKVWDGLTAEEIRKDMDMAGPINRAARRKAHKITSRLVKAISKVS